MKRILLALLGVTLLASSVMAGPLLGRRAVVVAPLQVQPVAVATDVAVDDAPDVATKRAFMRLAFRDRIEKVRGARRRLLKRIVADDDLLTIAIAYSDARQAQEPTLAVEEDEPDGKLFRFFKWVVEHQDQIVAFLQKIIALFEGVSPESMSYMPLDGGALLVTYQLPASHDRRVGAFVLR